MNSKVLVTVRAGKSCGIKLGRNTFQVSAGEIYNLTLSREELENFVSMGVLDPGLYGPVNNNPELGDVEEDDIKVILKKEVNVVEELQNIEENNLPEELTEIRVEEIEVNRVKEIAGVIENAEPLEEVEIEVIKVDTEKKKKAAKNRIKKLKSKNSK